MFGNICAAHPKLMRAAQSILERDFEDARLALREFRAEATYEAGWDFGCGPTSGGVREVCDFEAVVEALALAQSGRLQEAEATLRRETRGRCHVKEWMEVLSREKPEVLSGLQ